LSDRELLGELDHALENDCALECWILVATREVPEQLEQDLMKKGERIGVPVIVIDWKSTAFPSLAALCSADPDVVEALGNARAGTLARALQTVAAPALETLRKDLEAWCPGFNAIRKSTHQRLAKIWESPRTSQAEFGQNVAGGFQKNKVRRESVHVALSTWWGNASGPTGPAVLLGADGVGKTWAALDWMVDKHTDLPAALVVPSSTAVELDSTSSHEVAAFIARRLHEITGVRDERHWNARLERLLTRPLQEGPVLLICLDGMNQEPTVPWLKLIRMLQDDPFNGRVRVLMSTRNHHFTEKLGSLRGLLEAPIVATVDVYEASPGGELDKMLAFEGLTQSDLPPDLLDIARTPRLFDLLVRFREQLSDVGQVTLHRLLWEYGRDTLQSRSEKSFSENDWRAWLQEIARGYIGGKQSYSTASLADTTARAGLTPTEIDARLSDIIDGNFATVGSLGEVTLSPVVVNHALGAMALFQLETENKKSPAAVDKFLSSWLDPIAGLDIRAEILRAAVSIAIHQPSSSTAVTGALVSAWLQTQNVPEEHRREVRRIARGIVEPLLIAIQNAGHNSQTSARLAAVNALRNIPHDDLDALQLIVEYGRRWFCSISRDLCPTGSQWQQSREQRSKRWLERVGNDQAGSCTIMGLPIELVDENAPQRIMTVPSLLEGFPLKTSVPVLEAAALSYTVRGTSEVWDGLRWLLLFNEIDQAETTDTIRSVSEALRRKVPESGIHPGIPGRTAAQLLWLTGDDQDDRAARAIDSKLDSSFDYERDYLTDPGRSFFALERRHAPEVLLDQKLHLHGRWDRTKELWFDPTFEVPLPFAAELQAAFEEFDMNELSTGRQVTPIDHAFESAMPTLARCAPELLATLLRRELAGFSIRPAEKRFAGAIQASDLILLSDALTEQCARTIRFQGNGWSKEQECSAFTQLLMIEIVNKPGIDQWISIVEADLLKIFANFYEILNPISPDDADSLVARFESGTEKQADDLLSLFSLHDGALAGVAWDWLEKFAFDESSQRKKRAFDVLVRADRTRFGRELLARNWSWGSVGDHSSDHFGSLALIAASLAVPFDQLAPRLAPWTLLTAVRIRGGEPSEVRFAASLVGAALSPPLSAPDLGSLITIERESNSAEPFRFWLTVKEQDAALSMKHALDPEYRASAQRTAAAVAIERMRAARASGASLFVVNVDSADAMLLIRGASDFVDLLLEGHETRSDDFRRRVALAEGLYVALCDAFFEADPPKAVGLWKSLKDSLITRFIGAAEIDELTLMVFRARRSSESDALMNDLLDLSNANCDKDLLDLAIAAKLNHREDWLKQIINNDQASDSNWRRQRALLLAGFVSNNSLPTPEAWPDGPINTNRHVREFRSARFRYSKACASHWLKAYWKATTAESAFAAWQLFKGSADRRAWIELSVPPSDDGGDARLFRLKRIHAALNTRGLESAMAKRESKLDREFLGSAVVPGIGPWGKATN